MSPATDLCVTRFYYTDQSLVLIRVFIRHFSVICYMLFRSHIFSIRF
jgi:hypothetical protein